MGLLPTVDPPYAWETLRTSMDLACDLSLVPCVQMSFVSFDNATLDYILVIWVCMVRLPPSFLNIFQVPKVS